MHSALLIAALAGVRGVTCAAPARIARIHLVDGTPFVTALRPTLRARARADETRAGTHAFVLYDGPRPLATVRFSPDGTVAVRGYVEEVAGGASVEIRSPAAGCPNRTALVVLSPG